MGITAANPQVSCYSVRHWLKTLFWYRRLTFSRTTYVICCRSVIAPLFYVCWKSNTFSDTCLFANTYIYFKRLCAAKGCSCCGVELRLNKRYPSFIEVYFIRLVCGVEPDSLWIHCNGRASKLTGNGMKWNGLSCLSKICRKNRNSP